MANKLSMSASAIQKHKEESAAKRLALLERNTTLLSNDAFRQFLSSIANRAGYLDASSESSEWLNGYHSALRDIVNGVICNANNGNLFLSEYLAQKINTKKDTINE